ncbi:hypothetical protein K488DRAFT_90257 [Vararia minispora EC-137]|uniref:Uncharacterized protein n=1 Tax=Vararia minispora EC-137 TaxID=1314806 RepID=A0ACB8Q8E2_9AGAM|nr:hypothetical protein K488DRAFT_90257 [Vararia minispora EC-137]
MPSLQHLPSELYAAILDRVPPEDVQHTNATLAIAAPRSPVPRIHTFNETRLRTADRVTLFCSYVRGAAPDELARIRRFSLETWTVDADVVVNALRRLTSVERLCLFIGSSFAPEHTEELVERPFERLRFLSIRFRPYVKKATYYQFLKGAYFDSTVLKMAAWPALADLETLSIVQDPLDVAIAPTNFAQPIVFFRLDPLSTLAHSPLAASITSLRLRLPRREFVRFLVDAPGALPSLRLLDLSTSRVRDADAVNLLANLPSLHALIIDDCDAVHGGDEQLAEEWAAFGRALALAGHQRMRARERVLKEYRETLGVVMPRLPQREKKAKKGRKGLATATVSLREKPEPSASTSTALPVVQEGDGGPLPEILERVRVVPPAPTLRALAVTPSAHIPASSHVAIVDEFRRGWAEGMTTLAAIRARLRVSAKQGNLKTKIRVMRFARPGEEGLEAPLDGLLDASEWDVEESANAVTGVPVLCLAGPRRDGAHAEGCPHPIGWETFGDDL